MNAHAHKSFVFDSRPSAHSWPALFWLLPAACSACCGELRPPQGRPTAWAMRLRHPSASVLSPKSLYRPACCGDLPVAVPRAEALRLHAQPCATTDSQTVKEPRRHYTSERAFNRVPHGPAAFPGGSRRCRLPTRAARNRARVFAAACRDRQGADAPAPTGLLIVTLSVTQEPVAFRSPARV